MQHYGTLNRSKISLLYGSMPVRMHCSGKDRRAFESLLAPEFVEINTLGRFTREEFLDRLFPVLTLHEFTIEDPDLQIKGENTAVLSYRCYERLTVDKKPVVGTFRVTATYTRDGKQYRLSAMGDPAGGVKGGREPGFFVMAYQLRETAGRIPSRSATSR